MAGELAERITYARALAESPLLPPAYARQPANVLVAIEYGHALGIAPVEALNSINVINGKPSMSADLMAALVRRAGCKLRIKQDGEGREASVRADLIRPDDPDYTFTATWDARKASAAGVWDTATWRKYPEQMLRARAITEVCRQGANDFLKGVTYAPEELSTPDSTTGRADRAAPSSSTSEPEPLAGSSVHEDGTVERPHAATPAPNPGEAAGVAGPEVHLQSASGPTTATTTAASAEEAVVLASDETVALIYETAEAYGYPPERLAAACQWASGQGTQTPEELTEEQARALLDQMEVNALTENGEGTSKGEDK